MKMGSKQILKPQIITLENIFLLRKTIVRYKNNLLIVQIYSFCCFENGM